MGEWAGVDAAGDLVVQRTDDTMGVLIPLKIVVDDAPVGGLMPNQALALRLTSGEHRVRAGRSATLTVSVEPGGTVHVLAGHPPLPPSWRLVFDPRSTRPTLAVTTGAVAGPGPGEPTAARLWMDGWLPSFARFQVGLVVAGGILAILGGGVLAVLVWSEPVAVAVGLVIASLGAATVSVGAWIRRRLRRLEPSLPTPTGGHREPTGR